MLLLVDTNVPEDVLDDVLEDDPQWSEWSVRQLRAQSKIHRLAMLVCDDCIQSVCRRWLAASQPSGMR